MGNGEVSFDVDGSLCFIQRDPADTVSGVGRLLEGFLLLGCTGKGPSLCRVGPLRWRGMARWQREDAHARYGPLALHASSHSHGTGTAQNWDASSINEQTGVTCHNVTWLRAILAPDPASHSISDSLGMCCRRLEHGSRRPCGRCHSVWRWCLLATASAATWPPRHDQINDMWYVRQSLSQLLSTTKDRPLLPQII